MTPHEVRARDYTQITFERRGAIGVLTLNRPDRLNEWTPKDLLTRNAVDGDLKAVQRRELAALTQAYATAEHKAAIKAFMNKDGTR